MWMGVFLKKFHLLRCWGWLSLLNWIGASTLSLLLKLHLRKLEPWFILWSFFLLTLLCISINLPHTCVCSTVAMSGLVLLVAIWNCWISYKNEYAGTVGPSLAASLETSAHHRNAASLSLFYYRYHEMSLRYHEFQSKFLW